MLFDNLFWGALVGFVCLKIDTIPKKIGKFTQLNLFFDVYSVCIYIYIYSNLYIYIHIYIHVYSAIFGMMIPGD